METIKWENANALEIGMLMEMAEDGYVFGIEDGKIQAVEVRISASVERRTLCIIKMTFIRSSDRKESSASIWKR